MGAAPIGLIANPVAGRDVRRVAAAAAGSTVDHKISVLRRILAGAVAAGAREVLHLADRHDLVRRAGRSVPSARLRNCDVEGTGGEEDTTRAAAAMRAAGCAVVVVLGGDGTHRAAARGWPDAPMIAVSVGTNNVFPHDDEPTIVGLAAGLIAVGLVDVAGVATPSKLVSLDLGHGSPTGDPGHTPVAAHHTDHGDNDHDDNDHDLALIDAVVVDERFVGARALLDPARLRMAVVCRADPAAVGITSIAGLLAPCAATDDGGVAVWFTALERAAIRVRAPIAPGLVLPVGVERVARLDLGEVVEASGPAVLALDGERHLALAPGRPVRFTVERRGPRVVDCARVLHLAAANGWLADHGPSPDGTT